MEKCCYTYNQESIDKLVSTAKGAYEGYKKGGMVGAVIGGLKGYVDSEKTESKIKKYIIR